MVLLAMCRETGAPQARARMVHLRSEVKTCMFHPSGCDSLGKHTRDDGLQAAKL
jgi:hypothetical protein